MSEIIRRRPGRALSLWEAMDRFFEEGFVRPWLPMAWEASGGFALDMYETDEAFVIKTSAAGMQPEDVDIDISNNVLTIRGEARKEEEEEGARYHRMERYYGRFERSVALPTRVDVEKIEATLKDGVLTIEIPKAEEVRPKKVTIKVE